MTDETMTNDDVLEEAAAAVDETAQGAMNKASERLGAARETFGKVAGGVSEKVKVLGEKAGPAAQQFKENAGKASTAAKERMGEAAEKLGQGYDKVRKDMDHLSEDVNEYVRDNPGRSVLIAAGVGFLVGLLMRPHRGRD